MGNIARVCVFRYCIRMAVGGRVWVYAVGTSYMWENIPEIKNPAFKRGFSGAFVGVGLLIPFLTRLT